MTVQTARLWLRTNDMEQMKAMRDAEQDEEMRGAYQDMIDEMQRYPDQPEWCCEWSAFLQSSERQTAIGGLGFKAPPDKNGCVEVGYGINEDCRCRGYATESVLGLCDWAFGSPDVACVLAQTEPGNDISQRVLQKAGFVRDGFGDEGPMFKLYKTHRNG